eukprot:339803-Prorocentrum_minimum.AAC.1
MHAPPQRPVVPFSQPESVSPRAGALLTWRECSADVERILRGRGENIARMWREYSADAERIFR